MREVHPAVYATYPGMGEVHLYIHHLPGYGRDTPVYTPPTRVWEVNLSIYTTYPGMGEQPGIYTTRVWENSLVYTTRVYVAWVPWWVYTLVYIGRCTRWVYTLVYIYPTIPPWVYPGVHSRLPAH